MSWRITAATAARVLAQLRRDPRTVALLVIVPCVLLTLLRAVIGAATFARIAIPLAGIFPLISMFLVASIAVLRERTSGTLERLMAMPMAKGDLLFGYAGAFGAIAMVQAAVVCAVTVGVLGVTPAAPVAFLVVFCVANAVLGMAMGLFVSAFARTEFQAVQFMPAFLFPQLLLCGLFGPIDQMDQGLQAIAKVLPMTYAYDALESLTSTPTWTSQLTVDLTVLVVGIVVFLALGAVTLRRRTA